MALKPWRPPVRTEMQAVEDGLAEQAEALADEEEPPENT